MPFKSYKEESKNNWGVNLCDKQQISKEHIQLGAVLRIADACEKMAANHQQLLNDRDRYERWYELEKTSNKRLQNRISGLKGYIKRIKKKKRK